VSTNPYRLPRTVVPSNYQIHLTPDLVAHTFDGRVTIEVDIHESVTSFAVNALELNVCAAVVEAGGQRVTSAEPTYHDEFQTATFAFTEPLPVGPALVHLSFTGTLNDQLHGFYRSTYTDDQGVTHTLATTQFESHDARRAFPCWDDPAYKATYEVTLVVPEHLSAYSNASEKSVRVLGDGTKEVSFNKTMKMSTYLVAFVVGPFEESPVTTVRGTDLRVLYPIGKGHLTAIAIETGVHALEFFSEYFDVPYPGDKLDMIAIPDFAAGAMENLGLVTYRMTDLLVDPTTASHDEVRRVAAVINHEIAHMWFGDLVTMEWWEGIWLNEAFASFMEGICSDDFRPEWKVWVAFNPSRDMAFGVDGLHSTRAIEYEVVSPDDCRGMFDVLTYIKGAAVLRMLEQYLGVTTFRDGIRLYLKRHAYANTKTVDLWNALSEASGQDIAAIMNTWILQGGHPLVKVEQGTLSQEPFSYLPPQESSAIGTSWHVPVLSRPLGGATVAKQILSTSSATLATSGPAVVNAGGSGFYRTAYGDAELAAIASNLGDLDELERAVLFSDTWAAVLVGKASLGGLLTLAKGLVDLDEPSSWQVIMQALGMLDRIVAAADRSLFASVVRGIFAPLFDRLGWEPVPGESPQAGDLRAMALEVLGIYGEDEAVVAEALRRFDADELTGDLAGPIVKITANAGRPGTAAVFESRRVSATTPQEEQRYLFAMAGLPDEADARATFERCLTTYRNQDAPFLIGMLTTNRTVGVTMWREVTARWDELTQHFSPDMHMGFCVGVATMFASDELAREARSFHEAHPLKLRQQNLLQILDRLDRGAMFARRVRDDLRATLESLR
jgi:puromycin-sensitive aminopeptidase